MGHYIWISGKSKVEYHSDMVAADLILGQLGIVKAKTPVSVSVSESIVLENASIMAVSHRKKPDVELAPVVYGENSYYHIHFTARVC